MAFDKPTRNLLAKMVATCRRRLAEDVESQLQSTYGLYPDGTVLDVARTPDARHAADELRTLWQHLEQAEAGSAKEKRQRAYQRLVREIGFTLLNRLAALRLAEERGLVIECVRRGPESDGFQLFDQMANGALGNRFATYRAFLDGIYAELALDLGALFDRNDPRGLIFPGEAALADVLAELNHPDLAERAIWQQDETIGWIYQYYNDPAERKQMRDASQAPRNSRELAVRNQFFTPRYVVEFLTDNTLGRIWYEMTVGRTQLAGGEGSGQKAEGSGEWAEGSGQKAVGSGDLSAATHTGDRQQHAAVCRYLVRRPVEIFLSAEYASLADAADKPIVEAVLHGDYGKLPPETEWGLLGTLALLIDGYALAPKLGLGECGDFANARLAEYRASGEWRGNSSGLWICLYFEQRRWQHFGRVPTGAAWDELQALYQAWRAALLAEQEASGASQEELLHQPVYIAPRAAKDPRMLTMLDPACGSMHFGLYAFDLYETIYAEAWDRQEVVGRRQLAAGSGQRAVGSGQMAAGSGQRAVGSGQQAVSAVGDADDVRTVNRIRPTQQGDDHDSAQLPGLDRMAEGDGTGGSGLSGDEELPARGDVRADESTATSGSVDSIQYRRGTGTAEQSGLHPLPVDRARVGSGSGDTGDDRTASEFPEQGTGATVGEPGSRDRATHPRTYQLFGHAIDERTYARYLGALKADGWSYSRDDTAICPLPAAYPDKASFLRDVPRLIIEHNIHGIDIDPRAVQIANLSLWLRAQRSWQAQGVPAAERPRIRRSNVVTAEPMPGDRALLDEFVATLQPPVLGDLVRVVFDKMQLAGEAGSLLKIETELSDAIAQAKTQWEASAQPQQTALLPEAAPAPRPRQPELFDVSAIDDATFWERVEGLVLDALARYAGQHDLRHRLFAGDAARGFAFIDVCRRQYDVVLMNPPFGGASQSALEYVGDNFPNWNGNLLCSFIEHGWQKCSKKGSVGVIFDRTAIVKSTYEKFRREAFTTDNRMLAVADLGWGVLDANVEVISAVLSHSDSRFVGTFFDIREESPPHKDNLLLNRLALLRAIFEDMPDGVFLRSGSQFARLPNSIIGYDFPNFLQTAFSEAPSLEEAGYKAYQGHALKADRHFRVWWELPFGKTSHVISRLFNGSGYSPYSASLFDCVIAPCSIEALPRDSATVLRNSALHGISGVCFGKRGEFFAAHVLPSEHYFTVEGQAIPVKGDQGKSRSYQLLGFLNTPMVRLSLNKYCGQHKYSGYVNLMPFRQFEDQHEEIDEAVQAAIQSSALARRHDEIQSLFNLGVPPRSLTSYAVNLRDVNQNALRMSLQCEGLCHDFTLAMYQVSDTERKEVEAFRSRQPMPESSIEDILSDEDYPWYSAHTWISISVGSAIGRWDIRYGIAAREAPSALLNPFDALPACPPGMLQNSQGLPAAQADVPADYPLRIAWDGILVDDPGLGEDDEPHGADIVRRVREALAVLWPQNHDAIEAEACEILGVRELREYFRKPGGFFADHLKRYSKSRRQAPIYWPLSTASGRYTVWLYYHRLDGETLYTVVNRYVDPKIDAVERALAAAEAGLSQAAGRDAVTLREQADDLRAFRAELDAFRTELLRVAGLPYRPNLNDGVILNAAPLHRLFGLRKWAKDTEAAWRKLEAGDYDWAHIAYTIWPERVKDVCRRDRSIAIAHGLEELCEVEAKPTGRRKKRVAKTADLEYPDENEQDDE